MKIEYHEVPLARVVDHWVKDYKDPVAKAETFYDAAKQTFIFKIYFDEPSAPSHDGESRG